jgi:hypothetical protein
MKKTGFESISHEMKIHKLGTMHTVLLKTQSKLPSSV